MDTLIEIAEDVNRRIDLILTEAIDGKELRFRDGIYTRWDIVLEEMHKAVYQALGIERAGGENENKNKRKVLGKSVKDRPRRKYDPLCKVWPRCDCILQGRESDCGHSMSEYEAMMEILEP